MKILHVLASHQFSGAENVVCQIIDMFADVPNVDMAYCSPDGSIREALERKKIKFYPLKRLIPSEIKRAIREYDPDIIHAHDMLASCISSVSCGKLPLISHIHNNAYAARRISIRSLAYTVPSKKASHIFWVSENAKDGYFFKKRIANKSSVLCNIINVERLYEKVESDPNTYDYDGIFLGRLSYPKDPQRLMTVLAKAKQLKPDIRIAIVGAGELDAETRAAATELDLNENVDFLGFRTDPYKILKNSKVMLMTSRWEGLPMCVLEAMALGVPVVSTPVGGLKDIIFNGENGFLSDNNDELAKMFVEICTDSEMRRAFSKRNIQMSKELNNIQVYQKKILDEYLKAL